jgi:hypothetical protein
MKVFMKKWKLFGVIALAVVIGFSSCVIDAIIPSEYTVETTGEWIYALDHINRSGNNRNFTIHIIDDIEVQADSGSMNPTFGWATNIKITLKGKGKLYTASESRGYLISLGHEQTLIIDSKNLVLEGHSNNNYPLIFVGIWPGNAGMELKNGTICNNGGGGIKVNDSSTLVMSGGTISSNSAVIGGGVSIDSPSSTFTMFGGTIKDNFADNGGGVYKKKKKSVFNMSGGIISGNIANFTTIDTGLGGGVFVDYTSYAHFNKTGGIIYGYDAEDEVEKNTARANSYGHAVCYFYSPISIRFICDTTLDENTDISTSSSLPSANGATSNGWTRYYY